MNSDLSKCQVGDYIWTIRGGWCVVIVIGKHVAYPICCADGNYYSFEGKLNDDDKYPSAFVTPPECFNPEPKPCQFKKGDRVLVRDYDNIPWRRRYFAGENPNQHQEKFGTFAEGCDEWSADGRVRYWKYCKPWEEGGDE